MQVFIPLSACFEHCVYVCDTGSYVHKFWQLCSWERVFESCVSVAHVHTTLQPPMWNLQTYFISCTSFFVCSDTTGCFCWMRMTSRSCSNSLIPSAFHPKERWLSMQDWSLGYLWNVRALKTSLTCATSPTKITSVAEALWDLAKRIRVRLGPRFGPALTTFTLVMMHGGVCSCGRSLQVWIRAVCMATFSLACL